jgi:demethylmenaquinone methyltransferase/2-methoxy-6-polyprenyl-1,4-benzoquinol methylase
VGIIAEMKGHEEATSVEPVWSGEDLADNPHIVSDKARRVEAMFTAIARKYDLNNRLHSMWQDQVWRRRAVELANISKDDAIVDVACGTGDLAIAFCKAGASKVLGIDFTKAMLDLAVTKSEIIGLPIEYRQGNAVDLHLEDESANIVSIAFGIRNIQDPAKALSEFYRILKPGGRLVVLEFSTPPNSVIRVLNNFYTKRVMPITASIIASDTSGAYKYLPKSVESFSDAIELASEIQDAGFTDVQQTSQSFGVCTITTAVKN